MQRSARPDRYRMLGALADKLRVADIDPACSLHRAVAAAQTVVQNPRDIVPMDDIPDKGFLRVEADSVVMCHRFPFYIKRVFPVNSSCIIPCLSWRVLSRRCCKV